MSQLDKLKTQLDNPTVDDSVLEFCLESAKDIICDLRNATDVEPKYLNAQLSIAIEIFNKRGVEGQTSHSENGLSRTYEVGDISPSVIAKITPIAKTPWSKVRVI
jgi:hypothetical protein